MKKNSKMDNQRIREFWENRAMVKDTSKTHFVSETEADNRNFVELTAIDKEVDFTGKIVLDIGCGMGEKTIHFAKKARFVLGIDYTNALLNDAKKRAVGIGNIDFLHTDCINFDCDKKFDIIVVSALFIYLNDDDANKTMENIKKHLNERGKVVVKESVGIGRRFEVIDAYSESLKTIYNGIYRSVSEFTSLFQNNGFKLLHHNQLYQHRKETAVWLFVFELRKD
jgi:cyclopropane fatty-acyl-phospholipid synthase-like methyltransferase